MFGTSVKTIESDYKYRMITVDNSGYVRVHEPGRAKPNLLGECAGNSKKVLRFNKDRTKLFFISASDRSTVIEVDLKSIDLKKRERRFFHGKIIDIQVVKNTLVGLSKDGFVEFLDLSLPDYVPPKKKKKDDKQSAEEEPEPIIVKLSNSSLIIYSSGDIDEYTCLGYDSANQHFLAVGYRYYPPEDKSQPTAGGNKGTTTSAQIGFTNNVIISFTVADLCIVSTDIKIEGDKCRFVSETVSHLFKLVEGVQTARGLFYFAIGGGDSRAVYCINSRTLENTEILLKTSSKSRFTPR